MFSLFLRSFSGAVGSFIALKHVGSVSRGLLLHHNASSALCWPSNCHRVGEPWLCSVGTPPCVLFAEWHGLASPGAASRLRSSTLSPPEPQASLAAFLSRRPPHCWHTMYEFWTTKARISCLVSMLAIGLPPIKLTGFPGHRSWEAS